MKYIDADRLIAEIERLRKEHTTREYRDEAALVLEDLEDYIDSLQEEQGEKKTFDDYLKASPAERRKMNMTEILGAEKLAKIKEMMEQEQEQTEVDLEQEVISYFQGMWPGIDANTTMSFTPPAIMRLVKHFYELGKAAKPKVMQEVSDNVDKLRAISTPADEDWFEIAEEWKKEDKKSATWRAELIESSRALYYDIDRCITDLLMARFDKDEQHERKELSRMESLMVQTQQHLGCITDYLEKKDKR